MSEPTEPAEPGTLEHPEGEPVTPAEPGDELEPTGEEGPESSPTEPGDEPTPEAGDEPDGPEAPDEPPTEPVTPVGRTPEEMESLRKSLDTSANTWRRRVESLLGDDFAALVPCELCGEEIPGFHWPAELLQPETELEARLVEVLRGPATPNYPPAQNVRPCTACEGWGKVSTGSKVPGKGVVNCPACRGFGYTPPPGGAAVTADGLTGADELPALDDPEPPPAEADPWGSPRILEDGQENPNYGRMPQYKDASLP